MEINSSVENQTAMVVVKGRVDAITAPEFEKYLFDLLDQDLKKIIINMCELNYISSAGLRVILATAKQMKAIKGDILFVGLGGSVKEIFKISGFYSILKIFDTEEEALGKI